MVVQTRAAEQEMSTLLEAQAAKVGGVTNLSHEFIWDALFAANHDQFWLLPVSRLIFGKRLTGSKS